MFFIYLDTFEDAVAKVDNVIQSRSSTNPNKRKRLPSRNILENMETASQQPSQPKPKKKSTYSESIDIDLPEFIAEESSSSSKSKSQALVTSTPTKRSKYVSTRSSDSCNFNRFIIFL